VSRATQTAYDFGSVPDHGDSMARTSKRTNALLEAERVARLRESLDFRSNSEAVARGIDDRLAAERGLKALRELRRLGGPEDVFGRTSQKRK